jgi:hypothetical protein
MMEGLVLFDLVKRGRKIGWAEFGDRQLHDLTLDGTTARSLQPTAKKAMTATAPRQSIMGHAA